MISLAGKGVQKDVGLSLIHISEVQYLLDEENEETAESEAFSEESAELSE